MSYTLNRMASYDRMRCAQAGDETQQCNPEGATYLATAQHGARTLTRHLCANHAARLAHDKNIPFPTHGSTL